MYRKILAASAAALLLSMATFTAHAAIFDFTTENRSKTSSFEMSSDGVNLTVTGAYFYNNGSPKSSTKVTTNGLGLGVTNGWEQDELTGGKYYNDLAIFTFSEDVLLESVTFSNWDSDDDFTLFVNDLSEYVGTDFEQNYDFSAYNYFGQKFGIGAYEKNDSFMIKSFTVSTLSTVPLPSSVILFGGALVGLGWLSRRKMKSTKAASSA